MFGAFLNVTFYLIDQTHLFFLYVRVPTVMEKHGKKSCHGKSWKSHGKWAKKVVMEIQKGHGKVMEFLHCLSRITHEKFR